jgi:hypothetical protein
VFEEFENLFCNWGFAAFKVRGGFLGPMNIVFQDLGMH